MVSVMGFDFPNDFGKSDPIYANKILFRVRGSEFSSND